MKIVKGLSCVLLALSASVFTAACGWFEDDSEEKISKFYQPDDGITSRPPAGDAAGENDFDNPFAGSDLDEKDGAGNWGDALNGGKNGEMYADFGYRITDVTFEPVYFLFDQNMILKTQEDKLMKVADFLKGKPGAGIVIEGNCDERGTTEYNRSLGEKRALAAKTFLMDQGIDAARIKTISYGEERPAASGSGEENFKLNRRDEFVPVMMKK